MLTALVLLLCGTYKAHGAVGKPLRSGSEMALIGAMSALAGYLIGVLMKTSMD